MNVVEALDYIVYPTLDMMENRWKIKRTPAAERMLLAIAGQESNWQFRRQMGNGPARGFWQFEAGGGVKGVLKHPTTTRIAQDACALLSIPAEVQPVHAAIEFNDTLACIFARLLLLSDPKPLPEDMDEGWNYYLRCWRPGKPHPDSWQKHWVAADVAVRS